MVARKRMQVLMVSGGGRKCDSEK